MRISPKAIIYEHIDQLLMVHSKETIAKKPVTQFTLCDGTRWNDAGI